MSAATFIDRSLPPGDRNDAPELALPVVSPPPPVVTPEPELPAGVLLEIDALGSGVAAACDAGIDFLRAVADGNRPLTLAALQRLADGPDVKVLARHLIRTMRSTRE